MALIRAQNRLLTGPKGTAPNGGLSAKAAMLQSWGKQSRDLAPMGVKMLEG